MHVIKSQVPLHIQLLCRALRSSQHNYTRKLKLILKHITEITLKSWMCRSSISGTCMYSPSLSEKKLSLSHNSKAYEVCRHLLKSRDSLLCYQIPIVWRYCTTTISSIIFSKILFALIEAWLFFCMKHVINHSQTELWCGDLCNTHYYTKPVSLIWYEYWLSGCHTWD